jgi:hypothetical protein
VCRIRASGCAGVCGSVRMHTLRTCERERWKERESILSARKKVKCGARANSFALLSFIGHAPPLHLTAPSSSEPAEYRIRSSPPRERTRPCPARRTHSNKNNPSVLFFAGPTGQNGGAADRTRRAYVPDEAVRGAEVRARTPAGAGVHARARTHHARPRDDETTTTPFSASLVLCRLTPRARALHSLSLAPAGFSRRRCGRSARRSSPPS